MASGGVELPSENSEGSFEAEQAKDEKLLRAEFAWQDDAVEFSPRPALEEEDEEEKRQEAFERHKAEQAAERKRKAAAERREARRRETEERTKEEAKSVLDLLLDRLRGGPEEAPEQHTFGERVQVFFTESFNNIVEKLAFLAADVAVPGAGQALENAKKIVRFAESVDQYFREHGSVKLGLPIVVNRETGYGFDVTAQLDDGQVEEIGGEFDLFPAGIGGESPDMEPVEEKEPPEEADSSDDEAGETGSGGPHDSGEKSAESAEEEDLPPSTEGPGDEPRPPGHVSSVPSEDTRPAAKRSPSVPSDVLRPAPGDHSPEQRPEHRPEREFTLRRLGGSPVVAGRAGPSPRPAPQLLFPDDDRTICALVGDPAFFGTRFVDAALMMEYARLRVFEEQRRAHPPVALVRAMEAVAALRMVLFLDPESGLCLVVQVDTPGGQAYSPLLLRFEDPD
jgi:hypothetical protein